MALNISGNVGGTSDHLSSANGAPPVPSAAGTLALWLKPAWNSGDSVDHQFVDYSYQELSLAVGDVLRIEKYLDNNVYMGFRNATTDYRAIGADTGLFVSGVWAHHLVDYDSGGGGDTRYYVNNSLKYSAGITPVIPNFGGDPGYRQTLGPFPAWTTPYPTGPVTYGSSSNPNSDMAEFARWNRVLDATERAILAAGLSPLFIRRGLLEYRPLIAHSFSRMSVAEGCDLTVNAQGTSWTQHPPIVYPKARSTGARAVTSQAVLVGGAWG